jgi:hypothetical protein
MRAFLKRWGYFINDKRLLCLWRRGEMIRYGLEMYYKCATGEKKHFGELLEAKSRIQTILELLGARSEIQTNFRKKIGG